MPADPIDPDQLDGPERFRADLLPYLDSLPIGDLAALLGELPRSRQEPLGLGVLMTGGCQPCAPHSTSVVRPADNRRLQEPTPRLLMPSAIAAALLDGGLRRWRSEASWAAAAAAAVVARNMVDCCPGMAAADTADRLLSNRTAAAVSPAPYRRPRAAAAPGNPGTAGVRQGRVWCPRRSDAGLRPAFADLAGVTCAPDRTALLLACAPGYRSRASGRPQRAPQCRHGPASLKRSPGWPVTGCRTPRSAPGCSSARTPSSTTCARSSPSSASPLRRQVHGLRARAQPPALRTTRHG
jgi:hypothetical protein